MCITISVTDFQLIQADENKWNKCETKLATQWGGGGAYPFSWLAFSRRIWVSVETASRSQGSLEEEPGRQGKASAKTATYRRQEEKSVKLTVFQLQRSNFCH